MTGPKIVLRFDSDLNSLSLIGGVVRHLCEHVGFSQQDTYNIELCVIEAVTNSIRHGYGEEPGHDVYLTLAAAEDSIVLRVEDEGTPLLPERIAEAQVRARSDDALLEEGGRGLFIMESLMDEVVFSHGGGRNRVVMTKGLERVSIDGADTGR